MAEDPTQKNHSQDPPVFQDLSIKTRHFLRQANSSKSSGQDAAQHNMSTEQT